MLCYAFGKGMINGCVTTFEVHVYKMKCSNQKDSRERDNSDYEHEHTKTCSEEKHEYTISIHYSALTRN